MTAFENFQNLIKQYCQQHADILHDDDTNCCFVRFKTQQHLFNISTNAGPVQVIVFDFIGRANGDIDSGRLNEQSLIQFLVQADQNDDPYDRVDIAEKKALNLLFDFYARLKYDQRADSCSWLKNFDLELMTFEALEAPMLENHYGWSMTLPFHEYAPAYNADKWNLT
jgi:hypothetical protein